MTIGLHHPPICSLPHLWFLISNTYFNVIIPDSFLMMKDLPAIVAFHDVVELLMT